MKETRFPSVYVDYLGRQLYLWHQYGLTDARAYKLLRLWVGYGLTQYMDKEGRYTFHSFNQLRQLLGYKTIELMIDDLRRCQSFVLLSCDIDVSLLREFNSMTPSRPARELPGGLTCFYSPLWHALLETDGKPLSGSIPESRKNSRKCDDIYNNTIDNNIPSGGTASAVAAGEAAARQDGTGPTHNGHQEEYETLTVEELEALAAQELDLKRDEVRAYFRGLVKSTDSFQHHPISYLMKWLQRPTKYIPGKPKGFGLTAEEAQEVLEQMIQTELAEHFANDQHFWEPSKVNNPESRIFQVTRYIEKYSATLVNRSVNRWRKQQQADESLKARRLESAIRKNRPLSPYEWQDPEGKRWMEGLRGRVTQIQADAPPRPSERAQWNYIDNCWIE